MSNRQDYKGERDYLRGKFSEIEEYRDEVKRFNSTVIRIERWHLLVAFMIAVVAIGQYLSIRTQNNKIEIQNNLIEADRRSSLVFLFNNSLDQIDAEIRTNRSNQLSPQLIARIVSLSKSLKPYKYYVQGKMLDNPISPERGMLLSILTGSEISKESLKSIYTDGDFTYSELTEFNLKGAFLEYLDLSYSNLTGTNFSNCEMNYVDLTNCIIDSTIFFDALMNHANFSSKINHADFRDTELLSADFNSSTIQKSNFYFSSVSSTNFSKTKINNCNFGMSEFNFSKFLEFDLKNEIPIENKTNKLYVNGSVRCNNCSDLKIKYKDSLLIEIDSILTDPNSSLLKNKYIQLKFKKPVVVNEELLLLTKR